MSLKASLTPVARGVMPRTRACREERVWWRGLSSQSSPPWGHHNGNDGGRRSNNKRPDERDRVAGRRPACRTPAGAVDWIFSSLHCSPVLKTVLGGRFGHRYWASGWGDADKLSLLSSIHAQRFGDVSCGSLYRNAAADVARSIAWNCLSVDESGVSVWGGEFRSPVQDGTLPEEALVAQCQLILPPGAPRPDAGGPVGGGAPAMIHLAGLGDYTFVMRRLMMWPLARDPGIASLILQVVTKP